MSETNLRVVRRWCDEVWNGRRAELIDEILTPESVCHSASGTLVGPDGFREQMYLPLLNAFPDFHIEILGTVCEGDHLVYRWRATGTHSGEAFGIPPTGKPVTVTGMTCIRFHDGKMMEGWDHWNSGGLFQSLASREPALAAISV